MTLALVVAALVLLAAAPSAAAGEDPPPSLLERERLTGDWGGLRTTLATRGITIGFAYYGELIGIVQGGVTSEALYGGVLEPTVAVDLEKLARWRGGRAFFRGIGTYGDDPSESAGSIHHAVSSLSAPETFRLFEAWLEQRIFGDAVSILAGLYAVDTEFDVKETAGVFMNGGFGTGLDLSGTGVNGPCIFAVSCLGVRVRLQPTGTTYFQAALLDGVAGDPDDTRGTQIHLASADGALIIGEVGYRQGADEARFFKGAIGGWTYTRAFPDLVAVDANGDPRRRHGTYGLYSLVEGELYREAGERIQGLSGFVRVGFADDRVNQIAYSASAGLVYTGLIPGRDDDVTGLGVSVGFNGQKFKAAQRSLDIPVDDHETALEWTYRVQPLPWMTLQLDTQYIVNPGTDPALRDAVIVGVRYKIEF